GETVQDIALGHIRLLDAFGDDADHHVVRDELAPRHDGLGLLSDFRSRGDRGAKHVAGRKLNETVFVLKPLGLGALAGAGRSEKDQFHRLAPRNFDFLISPSYWCASRWLCTWDTVSIVTLTTMRSEVPPK